MYLCAVQVYCRACGIGGHCCHRIKRMVKAKVKMEESLTIVIGIVVESWQSVRADRHIHLESIRDEEGAMTQLGTALT